jgi:anti-sigma factor RsiW
MSRPINEQDEFLLSRLLDDDLSPQEAADLRARMQREPELQEAYQALSRIDSLLVARRADQPQVDWTRFHREVMDQVEAEAGSRRTIRLTDFLRVGMVLAAAASIALVVWFWPHNGAGIANSNPHPTVLAVNYPRPKPADTNDIEVSYVRSQDQPKEPEQKSSFFISDSYSARPTSRDMIETSPF